MNTGLVMVLALQVQPVVAVPARLVVVAVPESLRVEGLRAGAAEDGAVALLRHVGLEGFGIHEVQRQQACIHMGLLSS